ncbi:AT-rich interactive domain-containing protein 4A isoform X2 [Acipenser ruthenus]|uniref:AT-rich interactive domain-containing protein 4A isoform X2 n=1 Tax=Acipenser ruthenus TaxID=7906 RepID=UPI00274297FE|nr:AT-rich interactive domain-containing protein 4A isoform X2 [Acipenser ruthenus]
MKAADEPAYLTVGTDVSAKYRGAFCEAKIKTVKRLVKVKVVLKGENTSQVVQDDQVKGPLRVGATVEVKNPDGLCSEGVISKLTDASWYTVVFDDADERTLRRTSLCLKGERHFAASETLDQLPLTNPEHFGTPVIGKKTNRGRRSSLPVAEDEKEEDSSEEDDEDKRRLNDKLLGKVACVQSGSDKSAWYLALVISPSCNDDLAVKKDQCLVRSFADSRFYTISRKDIRELDMNSISKSELASKKGIQVALTFLKTKAIPESWKMDMSEILESSSSEEEDGEGGESDEDEDKEVEEEEPEEEPDPEERDNFLQQLYKFMEDRGTPINKPPVLGYKDLNLFKLFRLVCQQGGCDKIESGAIWKQIYMDLGIPILNSAASYNVKTAYRKYLYGFEEYCRSARIQFRSIHHNNPVTQVKVKEEVEEKEKEVEVEVEDDDDDDDDDEEEEPEDGDREKEKIEAEVEEPTVVQVKTPEEDDNESNRESEREKEQEQETPSPRGRRRTTLTPVKTVLKESPKLEKIKEENNKENEILEDVAEHNQNTVSGTPVTRGTTKPRPERGPIQEESDKETEEDEDEDEDDDEDDDDDDEDDKPSEREESENKEETEEEGDENQQEHSLMGTKVKVKYGRGKTQKIYEANIKNTEVDDGEVLYLVHYYGWNTRYDEWVKADRIIWPVDKGGTKQKQKKKVKNKDESDKEELEEKQNKSKRGRPPLKSTPPHNASRNSSKTPSSEGRTSTKSTRLSDVSTLPNGVEGNPRRRTRRTSGLYDSDRGSNDSGNSSESESDDMSEKKMEKADASDTVVDADEEQLENDNTEEHTQDQRSPSSPQEQTGEPPEEPQVEMEEEAQEPKPDPVIVVEERNLELQRHVEEKVVEEEEEKEDKKELEKSPKSKGRRSRSKEPFADTSKTYATNHTEVTTACPKTPEKVKSEETQGTQVVPEQELKDSDTDSASEELCKEDKKPVKRKAAEQQTPEKKVRLEQKEEQPITPEKRAGSDCIIKLEGQDCAEEENEMKNEMPALTPEVERSIKGETEASLEEIADQSVLKIEEDLMPQIGPEALVCHEVDLDDFDEKEKTSGEDTTEEKSQPTSPKLNSAEVSTASQQAFPVASPTALSPDESHSTKSESDGTIEVDSVAGESQEGLCESESANGFDASTSSSNCSISVQEREGKDRGHKRSIDCHNSSSAKKQKRNQNRESVASKNEKNGAGHSSDSEDLPAIDNSSKCTPIKHFSVPKAQKLNKSPARVMSPNCKDGEKEKHREKHAHPSTRTYKWTFQLTELDSMTSTDRISFLQDKLQEIRKYYMTLKSEVASIDRRRKRLKKKEREVSHTTASTSPGSSETGMSPPSASPTQNPVAVECR